MKTKLDQLSCCGWWWLKVNYNICAVHIFKQNISLKAKSKMSESIYHSGLIRVHGRCDKGFEPVQNAFVQNFISGQETNASLCVYVDRKCVIDMYGTAIGDDVYKPDLLQVQTFL